MHEAPTIRPIRTDADHRAALERIEELMDAASASRKARASEADELEVLATLVEAYEARRFPVDAPDPVAAIRFRMEQAGLRQRDLVLYLGSPSRVSEVLKGSRPLTVEMIRRLHEGLGIPLRSLVGARAGATAAQSDGRRGSAEVLTNSPEFLELAELAPVGEMAKRGWFEGFRGTPALAKRRSVELLRKFLGGSTKTTSETDPEATHPLLFRRSNSGRENREAEVAITLWHHQVLRVAKLAQLHAFDERSITPALARRLATLSALDRGPMLAAELLAQHGIALVTLAHLPRTRIDGAATRRSDGHPVIALTLRHNRLDHFWFTLLHELGHVALHLGAGSATPIVDEFADETITDTRAAQSRAKGLTDRVEIEADEFAREALIPEALWKRAWRSSRTSEGLATLQGSGAVQRVHELAREAGVHASIVAGRVRRETGDFRKLAAVVSTRLPETACESAHGGCVFGAPRTEAAVKPE
jgi:HTH-type transcriptional regulator/antitoxin HigA